MFEIELNSRNLKFEIRMGLEKSNFEFEKE